MKILHTADLHIGKKLHEQSLIQDQQYILEQILNIAKEEEVDVVVIAGDVYDRPIPPTEAVSLLNDFLTKLIAQGRKVIMISGNHDSPERVAFADAILEKQGLYIAGNYQEPLKTVTLEDAYGPVHFVCMPFVKPAVAGAASSEEAVEQMLSKVPMTMSMRQRYVLITHYFVTGEHGEEPELSDSETDINVGGLDNVSAACFRNFCYVALGHIHKPQHIGEGNVYYSGSPLKYSFSEARGEKSVNIAELKDAGDVTVKKRVLKPLREMRCVKGKLADILNPEVLKLTEENREDYLQVTLTDTGELIDPIGTLRSVYPNVLQLVPEKNIPQADEEYESKIQGQQKSTAEVFGEFFRMLKGEPMDDKRKAVVEEIAKEAERTML